MGETSTGRDLKGPFKSEEAACKVFAQKYRDKTKNAWRDENFVVHTGKYRYIRVLRSLMRQKFLQNSKNQTLMEKTLSTLSPKTRELIEVFFLKIGGIMHCHLST